MPSVVVLMIEPEQPDGLSSRKLVVETAKHNVLTAYTGDEGLALLERFPKVSAVLVHGSLPDAPYVIARIKRAGPNLPVILASPDESPCPGADHVISSHKPHDLVKLLARLFHDPAGRV